MTVLNLFAYVCFEKFWLQYKQQELFARGKLVMLRTCNQLLRRLSKVVSRRIVIILLLTVCFRSPTPPRPSLFFFFFSSQHWDFVTFES